MSTVRRKATQDQRSSRVQEAIPLDHGTVPTPVTLAMIQALIPLGLKAVGEALVREVTALAGPRYGGTRCASGGVHAALGHTERPRDGAMAQLLLESEAQRLDHLPHGYPLGWHDLAPGKKSRRR